MFTLSIILAVLVYKRIPGTMSIYIFTYGIWRFIAEYFRDDYRGSTFVDFLTPSQLTSLILFIGSGIVLFYTLQMNKRNKVEYENK